LILSAIGDFEVFFNFIGEKEVFFNFIGESIIVSCIVEADIGF